MKACRHGIHSFVISVMLTVIALGTAVPPVSAEVLCPDFVFCAVEGQSTR